MSEFQEDRTERATPKRLEDARKQGQVPRSRELTAVLSLLVMGAALMGSGADVMAMLRDTMQSGFTLDRADVFNPQAMWRSFSHQIVGGFVGIAPILAAGFAVALLAPLATGGLVFSPQALGFKASRLDPAAGLKRMFSWRALVELAKTLFKVSLVGAVFGALAWGALPELEAFGMLEPEALASISGGWLTTLFLLLSCALIPVALGDIPLRLWEHQRELRMSREQIREEHKETDGNPDVRRAIRRRQQEVATRRMMAQVPTANVIITNPEHYAVALKYEQGRHRAPIVVARGADLMALQIRHVARNAGVPVVAAPPLARSLYWSTQINQEIPYGLYRAVARILAYVFELRRATAGTTVFAPQEDELPIPPELVRNA